MIAGDYMAVYGLGCTCRHRKLEKSHRSTLRREYFLRRGWEEVGRRDGKEQARKEVPSEVTEVRVGSDEQGARGLSVMCSTAILLWSADQSSISSSVTRIWSNQSDLDPQTHAPSGNGMAWTRTDRSRSNPQGK